MTERSRSLLGRMLRVVLWSGLAALIVVPTLLVASWLLWAREVEPHPPFTAIPLDLAAYDIYDLGVVDANGDGVLDIFTTNHDARQSLLLGDGEGRFSDGLDGLGLGPSPAFPGLEDTRSEPTMDRPGLYIFFRDRGLRLVNHAAASAQSFAGTIDASLPVTVEPQGAFEAEVDTRSTETGAVLSTVRFTTTGAGRSLVQYPSNAVPIRIQLDPAVPLEQVFVGAERLQPSSHTLELGLRDRHGMAWNDITDDGRLDVFITRGGLFGWMDRLPETFTDELLIAGPEGGMVNVADARGIEKHGCSGRLVQWIDHDNDGLLDLYIACGRGAGGFWDYVPPRLRPLIGGGNFRDDNQLWRQTPDGRFEEVGEKLGLDLPSEGTFVWLDVAGNGWMDLLWAAEEGLTLFRNEQGAFVAEVLEPAPQTPVRTLLVADFDRDGDLDVFAAAAIGSRLLVNEEGRLSSRDPVEVGLPSNVRTASWVDYDNDGRIDFYSWPDGIFRQGTDGSFAATELAGMPSPYWWLVDPRVAWLDISNNGRRDLLVAQRWFPVAVQNAQPELFPFWSALFRNDLETAGHWLQVELLGPAGNRPAIGATVLLESTHGSEIQQVGQADSAHYSQGHYRLYFGLGEDAHPTRLTVRWPDGHVQAIEQPAVDRLLELARDPTDGYQRR